MIRFVAEITRDGLEVFTDISDPWWRWGPSIHTSISQSRFPFRAFTTFKTFRRYDLTLFTFRAFTFAIYMESKRRVMPLSFCNLALALSFTLSRFPFEAVIVTLSRVMRVSYMVRYAHFLFSCTASASDLRFNKKAGNSVRNSSARFRK